MDKSLTKEKFIALGHILLQPIILDEDTGSAAYFERERNGEAVKITALAEKAGKDPKEMLEAFGITALPTNPKAPYFTTTGDHADKKEAAVYKMCDTMLNDLATAVFGK